MGKHEQNSPDDDQDSPDHVLAARAVYDATADRFVETIGTSISSAIEGPLDRAILGAFAKRLLPCEEGIVVDAGCGPGRAAAYLSKRGLNVVGVDVAPRMVELARYHHPQIQLEEGRLAELPLADGTAVGVVCWYSIIHTPLDQLPAVWAELRRVLVNGGRLLVAFQSGENERLRKENAYDTNVTLDLLYHAPVDIVASLTSAGFRVHAVTERQPELLRETTAQAFIEAQLD